MSFPALSRGLSRRLARVGIRHGANHPSFEHHQDWAKNKWKGAVFVGSILGLGIAAPVWSIAFAQSKARSG